MNKKTGRESPRPRPTVIAGSRTVRLTAVTLSVGVLIGVLGWLVTPSRSSAISAGVIEGPWPEVARSAVLLAKSGASFAPDFTAPTLGGGEFTLSAHRGKPVVLFFMAYWCGTCVGEAQALAKLHNVTG